MIGLRRRRLLLLSCISCSTAIIKLEEKKTGCSSRKWLFNSSYNRQQEKGSKCRQLYIYVIQKSMNSLTDLLELRGRRQVGR